MYRETLSSASQYQSLDPGETIHSMFNQSSQNKRRRYLRPEQGLAVLLPFPRCYSGAQNMPFEKQT